jgi:BirA family biotin operon repressor/biotin-[acetyl-CoA-carboxylase] ligase
MSTTGAERVLGTPRLHLRRTSSTNDRARVLAQAGAPDGTLVTAAEQTLGRGRQGRTWSAPPGRALLMSLVIREPPKLLPLAAAVAVAAEAGDRAQIKWPNDVLDAGDRKLAGILVEGRPQEGWAVLGIGLNVALRAGDLPEELRGRAGSLGRPVEELEPTLVRLLRGLERSLQMSPEEVLGVFRTRDALVGRRVTWSSGSGTAQGIDGDGRLVVLDADGGRTALKAGEVHLGPPVGPRGGRMNPVGNDRAD